VKSLYVGEIYLLLKVPVLPTSAVEKLGLCRR
jgi:hypothetical protein